MKKIIGHLKLKNITIREIDITNLDDIKSLFLKYDYIFSASVFEHIHPEKDGDITAVKNIRQILKENGLFVLSIPFYLKAFNEYKYGDAYSVKGEKDSKIFFQRFYDEAALKKQIITPSGLALEAVSYLGERFYFPNNIQKRFAALTQSKISSVLFGKFLFVLSNIFMKFSYDYKNLKKPYIATVALRNKK